jgi:hypothetical protein
MNLAGKRVLMIAPKFFGYEKDILGELARRGAEVDFLRDRPFDSALMIAATRFVRPVVMSRVDRQYREQLAAFGRSSYDLILVVNGQTLSQELLANLRTAYPTAPFVLYLWDSIANRQSTRHNLVHFDRVFTFDPQDAKAFNLQLRPLFFSPGFEASGEVAHDIDISFIGTAHTDRAKIVGDVDRSLPADINRYWYLYLQAPWVFAAYKVTNPTFRHAQIEQFSFDPLARDTVRSVFARSKAVLDIEHPRQIGLTMRTFETFGASKKLLTTNSRIYDSDFYNPANILVLDRRYARVPQEFLLSPYVPPSPGLYRKYSLAGWADEILSTNAS